MENPASVALVGATVVRTREELRAHVGEPLPRVAHKDRPRLEEVDRAWIAASSFCLVATSAADGSCDVSPKGDPPGFALVLDDVTVALPERPGNRRADGFENLLANPHVGLLFLLPGRGDTLRVNGRASLVADAPFFDRMEVHGHRPVLALVVHVEQVFYHCAKAFLRSHLWEPATWTPDAVPSQARTRQAPGARRRAAGGDRAVLRRAVRLEAVRLKGRQRALGYPTSRLATAAVTTP